MNYSYLKLIHLIAVILFLGNMATSIFWMHLAVKTKDVKIISFAAKSVIKADRYFTIPGVIIITAGGFLAAVYGHWPIIGTGWILWSIILFSISGFVIGYGVVPLQSKIYKLTLAEIDSATFNWGKFNKLYFAWRIWAIVAFITPMAVVVMMTLKIPQ